MVADEMERWVDEGDVDGFNIVSRTSQPAEVNQTNTV
jgi:hypothetical protein